MNQAKKSQLGFSLVEVIIALGIVSFAIITTMGIFPIALKTFQESRKETISMHIVQEIVNEFNLLDVKTVYEAYHSYSNNNPQQFGESLYYDDQGVATTKESTERPAIYTVNLSVGIPTTPGNTTSSKGLMVLEIKITSKAAPEKQPRTYSVFIANQGDLSTSAYKN